MINGLKIVVVMPAYNAAKTLERTYAEISHDLVDELVLVDDHSHDHTVAKARELGIKHIIQHNQNKGYGGNQKSCYEYALKLNADIIIMLHPDYQYSPLLIPAMAHLIATGLYPVVLGSRILGGGALQGGMPAYKYFSNRLLTASQNILTGAKLSEYHTGYRAYSRHVLETIPFKENSDDFIFDNEMLCQIIWYGYAIGEISCPTRYFPDASSINFKRSVKYGIGVVKNSFRLFFHRYGLWGFPLLQKMSREV